MICPDSPAPEVTRSCLIGVSDWYFHGLLWSTGVLVLGAMMEEFPNPFGLIRPWRVDLRTGVQTPRSAVLKLKHLYHFLAVVMVVGGIAGEGIFEYWASSAEGDVREFDNRVTLAARISATDALKRATEAEAILAPRSLTDEQARSIKGEFRSLDGRDLIIGSHWIDAESARFALQIKSALNAAGVGGRPGDPDSQIGRWPRIPTGAIPGFSNFQVPDVHTGIEVWGKDRKLVAENLKEVMHLDVTTPDTPSPFGFETDNLVSIFVGLKPLPEVQALAQVVSRVNAEGPRWRMLLNAAPEMSENLKHFAGQDAWVATCSDNDTEAKRVADTIAGQLIGSDGTEWHISHTTGSLFCEPSDTTGIHVYVDSRSKRSALDAAAAIAGEFSRILRTTPKKPILVDRQDRCSKSDWWGSDPTGSVCVSGTRALVAASPDTVFILVGQHP